MKKTLTICLICLILITGCSSNDGMNDLENRITELEKDLYDLQIQINNSQAMITQSIESTESESNNEVTHNNTDDKLQFNYAEHGIFHLDDMSVEEVCKCIESLLLDFPKENTTLDAIKEHYNKGYGMNNVDVNFLYNNNEQSKFEIEYQNNLFEVIHTDYIKAIFYTFPLSVQTDNTLKYESTSQYHPKCIINFCIYADSEKASAIYRGLVEIEKNYHNTSEETEASSQRSWHTIISNSDVMNLRSSVTCDHKDSDYYEFGVAREYTSMP